MIEAIKQSFLSVFGEGLIYLFGSRVDDSQKGGDTDLYIDTQTSDKVSKKIDFLVALKNGVKL